MCTVQMVSTASSVIPFSFCLKFFPASGSFLMSQLFASGSQSIGASASASILLMNVQDWFPLGLTGFISLQSKELSRVFFNTTVQKHHVTLTSTFICVLHVTLTSTFKSYSNKSHVNHVTLPYFLIPTLLLNDF